MNVFSLCLQAIFELSQGEEDLIEDLKLAKKVNLNPVVIWATSFFFFFLMSNFTILRLCLRSTLFMTKTGYQQLRRIHTNQVGGKMAQNKKVL